MSESRAPVPIVELIEDFGLIGGAEQVVLDLVAGLDRELWHPCVAIVNPQILPDLVRERGGAVIDLPPGSGVSYRLISRLRRELRQLPAGLLHSHLLKMNTLGALAGRWAGVTTIGSIHGILNHETTSAARRYARLAYRLSHRTVVVSDWLGEYYRRTYSVGGDKVTTIHNGFNPMRLTEPTDSEVADFKSTFGLFGKSPIIVAVGNVKPVKGYDLLIDAAARLKQTYPEIRVLIAGRNSGDMANSLREHAASRGVAEAVTFIGELRTLGLLFAIADVYVSTSRHEGFSLTTIEAMASRIPVVVTDCGGPSEIVRHEQDGLVVPNENVGAIAAGIQRILTESGLAVRLADAGYQRAHERFTLERMVASHDRLYRELTSYGTAV